MDILVTILCATVAIGFLVFIHEGGHYLAARAFGVRVTEFMLGLPGPSIGFKRGGTRFGVTAIPLGGYARVCGMEAGEMSPHLERVLEALYTRGTASVPEIAAACGITDEEAVEALEELSEWGSAIAPKRFDTSDVYRAPETYPTKRSRKHRTVVDIVPAPVYKAGEARPVPDAHRLFEAEYAQQYRALPFWKRSVILLAGIATNLLFAMLVFVLVFSVIGFDVQMTDTGEVVHRALSPLQAIQAGFIYIGMVVQAVINLFNPATVAQTVSDSTSIVGIAVLSKTYFEQGLIMALQFMAMISVSLGIMNLIPIPPLDGGCSAFEIFQQLTRKTVSMRVLGYLSMAGMALFLLLFVVMLNQDVQRFIFGNW